MSATDTCFKEAGDVLFHVLLMCDTVLSCGIITIHRISEGFRVLIVRTLILFCLKLCKAIKNMYP